MIKYFISASWTDSEDTDSGDWYRPLKIVIENATNEDVSTPTISFDTSNIPSNGEIRAYTGFVQETFTGVIKGTLSDQLSILKAKSTVSLTFGVNFPQKTINPPLPINYTFNGEPIVVPVDHTPPTIVENIEQINSDPKSLSLSWAESTDADSGVQKYIVKYNLESGAQKRFETTVNSISLKGLTANTKYDINISAVDYAGNISAPSQTFEAFTSEALQGPAKWQSGLWIKGTPFVDSTSWPTPPIDKWASKADLKGYFLGFGTAFTETTTGEIKACWGGNITMVDANDNSIYDGDMTVSDYYKNYINNIRQNGGDIVMSFGGAVNQPIEALLKDIKKIVDIYEKIIANYELKAVDFDFEGSFLANTEALDNHIAAITQVIQKNPELKISYTLPVDGAPGLMGLNRDGEILLKKLYEAGITPSLINAMSMEFGQGSSADMFECVRLSIEGAGANANPDGSQKGLIKQIKKVYTELSEKEIYQMVGICPMFATHLNGKVMTVEDVRKVSDHFAPKGVAVLNGWDATIDSDPSKGGVGGDFTYEAFDYSKVLAQYTPVYDEDAELAGNILETAV